MVPCMLDRGGPKRTLSEGSGEFLTGFGFRNLRDLKDVVVGTFRLSTGNPKLVTPKLVTPGATIRRLH